MSALVTKHLLLLYTQSQLVIFTPPVITSTLVQKKKLETKTSYQFYDLPALDLIALYLIGITIEHYFSYNTYLTILSFHKGSRGELLPAFGRNEQP